MRIRISKQRLRNYRLIAMMGRRRQQILRNTPVAMVSLCSYADRCFQKSASGRSVERPEALYGKEFRWILSERQRSSAAVVKMIIPTARFCKSWPMPTETNQNFPANSGWHFEPASCTEKEPGIFHQHCNQTPEPQIPPNVKRNLQRQDTFSDPASLWHYIRQHLYASRRSESNNQECQRAMMSRRGDSPPIFNTNDMDQVAFHFFNSLQTEYQTSINHEINRRGETRIQMRRYAVRSLIAPEEVDIHKGIKCRQSENARTKSGDEGNACA
ncbi:hypothetical protein BJ138DRAFT_1183992 [Hygrophoropsis aurantiaca]|uniref:Uncharacterized protein n=1 Tax=Hygrophoropsis aurantiaca TaxID=72124 RepID=A0ACB7ZUD2_9AGAM|nr:hypothetical protein BJ138DRAFT_1183992 [Hygrophoropsis aurantiaca]